MCIQVPGTARELLLSARALPFGWLPSLQAPRRLQHLHQWGSPVVRVTGHDPPVLWRLYNLAIIVLDTVEALYNINKNKLVK